MTVEDRLRGALRRGGPDALATEAVWARIGQRAAGGRRMVLWRRLVAVLVPVLGLGGVAVGLSGVLSPAAPPGEVAVVPGPGIPTWTAAGSALWHHGQPGNYLAFGPATMITCAGRAASSCYLIVQANGTEPDGTRDKLAQPGFAVPLRSSLYRFSVNDSIWTGISLPSDAWLSSPLTCTDATHCAGGAVVGAEPAKGPGESGRAVILMTSDGGRHWSVRDLPATVGLAPEVSCTSPTHCVALTWDRHGTDINGLSPHSGSNRFFVTTVLNTDDGGQTWRRSVLPVGPADVHYQLTSIECPGRSTCYAMGEKAVIVTQPGGSYGEGATSYPVLSTNDGGHSWKTTLDRAGVQPSSIACASASSCMIMAQRTEVSADQGPPVVFTTSDYGLRWQNRADDLTAAFNNYGLPVSCVSALRCLVATASSTAATSDGGRHWKITTALPAPPAGYEDSFPNLTALSCTASGSCFAVEDMNSTARVLTSTPWK